MRSKSKEIVDGYVAWFCRPSTHNSSGRIPIALIMDYTLRTIVLTIIRVFGYVTLHA